MSQASNKIQWCLRKAEKELKESGRHRGIVKTREDYGKAIGHIRKAERFLSATEHLKKGGYSDMSTSTVFYAMYHCLLAVAAKHGYDSRNQECTFALVYWLIEEGKIGFDKELLERIASLEPKDNGETSVSIREKYQYGTEFSVKENLYGELVELARETLSKTKIIIEE